MTRISLIRHGPTHEKTFVGWRDVPADLSDADRIARLDSFLPRNAVLVSSDLTRAVQTADAIANGRDRLPGDPALREFDFGTWDGQAFDAVAASEPDLSRQFWEQPGDIAPPHGESWNNVAARVSEAVLSYAAEYPDGDVIIVAHIGVIMTQIARAAGCTPYQAMGHHIDNLSVTEIFHNNGKWSVGQINHCP